MIFAAPQGLSVRAGSETIELDALSLSRGEAVAVLPPPRSLGVDMALSRAFTTLRAPLTGHVELFGTNPAALDYFAQLALRTRLGFVPGQGGLFSNRSLRENVALPVSIHRRHERARVAELLVRFELESVAERRPHEVDGATRFRTCAARALVLAPTWLVIEGTGDFDGDEGPSLTWQRLMEARSDGAALAVCLPRRTPSFTRWFTAQGGRLLLARSLALSGGKTA